METVVEVPPKKPKLKQNIQLSECIRQFELHQQYPSTVTELRLTKPGTQKSTTVMQTKSMQNIISALPLPGKMKFIPNKEIAIPDNLQKLKLKLPDGRDVGEVKLVLPGQDEKPQTKVITMSKIGQTNEKPITWTIQSPENGKPRIKTITKLSNSLPMSNESFGEYDDEAVAPKMKVQLVNGNQSNGIKTVKVVPSMKRLSTGELNDSGKQKIVVHNSDSGVLKKVIIENPNILMDKQNGSQQMILKKFSGSPKMVMLHRDGKQLLKPLSDKPLSLKPVTQSTLQNHNIKNNAEKIIFKSAINGSIIRKKEVPPSDNKTHYETKRSYSEMKADNNEDNTQHSNDEDWRSKLIKLSTLSKKNVATGPRKNIMVIVPNEEAEKLSRPSSSTELSSFDILQDDDTIITINEEIASEEIPNIRNNETSDFCIDEVRSIQNELEVDKDKTSNVNKVSEHKNTKSQDTVNQLNILKQAVLSVQDANLRAKALKALKDCGIKVKKTVPVKRPTKTISESATQTEVFALLKDDEFLQINNESENIFKIKNKIMKQSLNTLPPNTVNQNTCPEFHKKEFKKGLDQFLDKVFAPSKCVNVKEAFEQDKKAYAKAVFKQLQKDYNAAKNYDNDGLLGIHKAVLDNSIRDVQRHLLMLKTAKQNIDVPSLDEKTSLELAVEFEADSQIIKILLEAGAQPVSSKPIHDSAIIIAAKTSSKVLFLLLEYITRSNRSLLNRKNAEGLAAIHYLTQNGNLKGVTELLKHGVEVNLQDSRSGRTALFYAVETKNSDISQEVYNEIAHKLLEHEAISNIPTFSKHSVLSMIDDVKSHALKVALNKAVK